MMEEVSDDTNGESTFEFVGDKSDDSTVSLTSGISNIGIDDFPTGLSPPMPQPTTVMTTAISTPLTSAVPHPPVSSLPPPSEPFIPSLPTQQSPNNPNRFMSPLTPPTPSESVPMYNTKQVSESSDSFVNSLSSSLLQPIPAPAPAPQVYQAGLASNNTPIQTPPQPSYASPTNVPMASAALNLPYDDSYTQVSLQSFPERPGVTGSSSSGVWGWLKGSEFLNKVAEKAKNSVDSMITTLDPGMKEIIYSGGDIDIVVASDKEVKVSSIREAFLHTFGRATVRGVLAQASSIAAQPIGYSAGLKAAEERINFLRQQGLVHERQPVISVENFLVELTPDRWFDVGCLLLHDPNVGEMLHVYTQATPVPSQYVFQAQERTPSDYPLRWSGLAVTIGQVIGSALGVPHSDWHQAMTGVSRKELLILAASSLSGIYKMHLRR